MAHNIDHHVEKTELMLLPNCLLEEILLKLSYDEIAQHRRVSLAV